MRKLCVLRSLIILVLITLIINYANSQIQENNLNKDEIIKKAWKAMFGNLKSEELKSIYLEGYFHGSMVPNKTTIVRPNLFRSETKSGILVFDGKRAAWTKRTLDKDGRARKPGIIDSAAWKHFEIDIAIAFPAFFDYPSELIGVVEYEGEETYKILVKLPLGGFIHYFINAKSFLITKRLVNWDGNPNEKSQENLINDYVNYDGVFYPDGYTFEGRNGLEKGLFKNLKFNIKVDENFFLIPEELK